MNPKLCLAIGVVCISFSPIFVKLAGAAPISAAFYRVFIAWLCVLPYCIAKNKLQIDRSHLFIALTAGAIFALDIGVWNISLLKISATISTLVANLAPLWVGLLSFLLLKKRESISFWLGTVIAIGGMIVLVGFENVMNLQLNAGILLAMLSSLLYASYILITKTSMGKMDGFTFMFYSMIGAGVTSLIMCFISGNPILAFSSRIWLCFIAMGLICQLTGWLTINYAIHHMEPTKVSVALLGQTVIAGMLAAFLLGERLHLKELIGSAVVLAGIGITFFKPRAQSNKIVS